VEYNQVGQANKGCWKIQITQAGCLYFSNVGLPVEIKHSGKYIRRKKMQQNAGVAA
jgi:hypothetical protein